MPKSENSPRDARKRKKEGHEISCPCESLSARLLDDVDGFLDVVMSSVDVQDGALLKTLGEPVVLFLANVAMRLID